MWCFLYTWQWLKETGFKHNTQWFTDHCNTSVDCSTMSPSAWFNRVYTLESDRLKAGQMYKVRAQALEVSQTVICRLWDHFSKTGTVHSKSRESCQQITPPAEDHYFVFSGFFPGTANSTAIDILYRHEAVYIHAYHLLASSTFRTEYLVTNDMSATNCLSLQSSQRMDCGI